jgi:hypothetical protein
VLSFWRTDGTTPGRPWLRPCPARPAPVQISPASHPLSTSTARHSSLPRRRRPPAASCGRPTHARGDGAGEGHLPRDQASTDANTRSRRRRRVGFTSRPPTRAAKRADRRTACGRATGTAEGTVEVLDKAPGVLYGLRPTNLVAWEGGVVFVGTGSMGYGTLWRKRRLDRRHDHALRCPTVGYQGRAGPACISWGRTQRTATSCGRPTAAAEGNGPGGGHQSRARQFPSEATRVSRQHPPGDHR